MEYDIDDDPPFVQAPRLDHDWWRWTAEYRTVFRLTFPTQIFWLCVYLVLFLVVAPKVYGHELEEGTGVVCDTPAQVEQFVELGAQTDALRVINVSKVVCGFNTIHYIRGRDMKRIRSHEHAYTIVEILIIQVRIHGQWAEVPPEVQYTVFEIEETPA